MEALLFYDDAYSEFHKAFASYQMKNEVSTNQEWFESLYFNKIPKLVVRSKTHFYFLKHLLSFFRLYFILFFERFVQLRDNEWWDSRRSNPGISRLKFEILRLRYTQMQMIFCETARGDQSFARDESDKIFSGKYEALPNSIM